MFQSRNHFVCGPVDSIGWKCNQQHNFINMQVSSFLIANLIPSACKLFVTFHDDSCQCRLIYKRALVYFIYLFVLPSLEILLLKSTSAAIKCSAKRRYFFEASTHFNTELFFFCLDFIAFIRLLRSTVAVQSYKSISKFETDNKINNQNASVKINWKRFLFRFVSETVALFFLISMVMVVLLLFFYSFMYLSNHIYIFFRAVVSFSLRRMDE